jgi:transcriptional regulator with XRE-family HTH domain
LENPQQILKKAREAKGLTQEALAEKVGISHRMLQRYEEGKFPKYKGDGVRRIDDILGTNLCDIIYDKQVPPAGHEQAVPSQVDRRDYTAEYIESLKLQVQESKRSPQSELITRLSGIEATLVGVLSLLKKQADWMELWMAGPPAEGQAHPGGVSEKPKGNIPAVEQLVYSGKGTRPRKGNPGKK